MAANALRTPPAQYTTTVRGLVEQPALDLRLEVTARDVDGVGQRALVVLVGLAHVEHDGAVSDALGCRRRIDLGDLGLGGAEQISESGHELKAYQPVGILLR